MKILTIKWSKEFKGKKIKNINHKIKAKIKMIKRIITYILTKIVWQYLCFNKIDLK